MPHEIAITGRHDADLPRLARDLARICDWQIGLFGEAPFDRYLFQVTAVGDGYGGLEHRASTSLLCRRDELPHAANGKIDDDYLTLLGLASHEYFHAWNVKRIKPAAFVPYDLTREAYTRQLWAFEGFTSYYDDLALVRSGLIEPEPPAKPAKPPAAAPRPKRAAAKKKVAKKVVRKAARKTVKKAAKKAAKKKAAKKKVAKKKTAHKAA